MVNSNFITSTYNLSKIEIIYLFLETTFKLHVRLFAYYIEQTKLFFGWIPNFSDVLNKNDTSLNKFCDRKFLS